MIAASSLWLLATILLIPFQLFGNGVRDQASGASDD
jgi:hypothetical protein